MERLSIIVCVVKRVGLSLISNLRKLRSHEGNKLHQMEETNRLLQEILTTLINFNKSETVETSKEK